MALFGKFHVDILPINSLNFGTIILLPKGTEAKQIQQYRPICLLNVSFKIFTKVITNRVVKIAQRIIKPTQTAFLPGRNIMEGAVILHETHELHVKKQSGVIFKIDFEKAYDNIRWDFLQQTLRIFKPRKAGDKVIFVPILFNIVVDTLAIILDRAKSYGQVRGVIPHLIDEGLSILQYADDTIIFMDHDIEQAKNLKLILSLFEQLSGLKINFHKSEIFCFGQVKESEDYYSALFGCKVEQDALHRGKIDFVELSPIELAYVYALFFEAPKGVLKKIEHYRSRFFWQNDNHKKKYRLVKWYLLCQPKEQGGLGVQNLYIQNKCLLSKWLFKLCNEDGMWQSLLRNKYLSNKTLSPKDL
ncbi:hypothetical protein U9M48_013795 [Paspalum notatum var. saurae]|uniref:Reverse transcriptase domain-containing protein n=1 Tax=Paspalum notatum var. saurae TaxID=547442 RepID=A0AAQ3WJW2_PASNO